MSPGVRSEADTAAELVLGRAGDGRVGVIFEGTSWTWAEVVDDARALAAWMERYRRPGPFHIGVLLDNTPDFVVTIAAAALSGAVVVGLNPTRRGPELARDVRHTECQLVLSDAARIPDLDGLDLGVGPDRIVQLDGADHLADRTAHAGSADPHLLPRPEDLFFLIFTSGSTGAPKAVRMSQGRAARAAAAMPFKSEDILYSAMPLFHGNGLVSNMFPALRTGATVVLRRRFSASGFLDDIRLHRCTYFNAVGRAVAHILATTPTPHDRDHDLAWVLGPETADSDRREFTERFGAPIFGGYGSSEAAFSLLPPRTDRPGALGTAPEGVDVAVVDPESADERPVARFDEAGRLLNPEEAIGELVSRNTADSFEGYWNDPEAEAARRRGGWYWSGDLAYRDGDGIFYFAGRTGDWLRVDSENFTAAPIERILVRARDVAGVAVYPVPDVRTGDQVMAAIEMSPGRRFDPDGFSTFLAAQADLGPKWVPRYVRIVDTLPTTGNDKLNKAPLRKQGWDTADEVWHRPDRAERFRLMTADDRVSLIEGLAEHGRSHLLAP